MFPGFNSRVLLVCSTVHRVPKCAKIFIALTLVHHALTPLVCPCRSTRTFFRKVAEFLTLQLPEIFLFAFFFYGRAWKRISWHCLSPFDDRYILTLMTVDTYCRLRCWLRGWLRGRSRWFWVTCRSWCVWFVSHCFFSPCCFIYPFPFPFPYPAPLTPAMSALLLCFCEQHLLCIISDSSISSFAFFYVIFIAHYPFYLPGGAGNGFQCLTLSKSLYFICPPINNPIPNSKIISRIFL